MRFKTIMMCGCAALAVISVEPVTGLLRKAVAPFSLVGYSLPTFSPYLFCCLPEKPLRIAAMGFLKRRLVSEAKGLERRAPPGARVGEPQGANRREAGATA